MAKLLDRVRQAGGVAGVVSTAYSLAIGVEGAPIREPLKASKVRVLGIPIFVRDASLDRYWFGVIKRGKSKAAKAAIARGEV